VSEKGDFSHEAAFRAEGWLCEPRLNRMTRDGRVIQVEPKVMEVLVCLAGRGGEVVTRNELLETVWAGTAVSEQVLSRAVSELRKVFRDDSRTPRVIETIAKRGYRLIVPVEPAEPTPPPAPVSGVAATSGPRSPISASRWLPVAAALAVGLLLATWYWRGRPANPGAAMPGMTASFLLPAEAPPAFSEMRCFDLSPDGTRLVYTATIDGRQQLYSRRIDRDEVVPILGTEGGFGPFFSPDGSQIGFYVAGKLQRIPTDGGDAVTLTDDASDAIGATWRGDGTIVYVRRFLDVLYWIPPGQGPRALRARRGTGRAVSFLASRASRWEAPAVHDLVRGQHRRLRYRSARSRDRRAPHADPRRRRRPVCAGRTVAVRAVGDPDAGGLRLAAGRVHRHAPDRSRGPADASLLWRR
jgi:DNA-binding winged helix-turn-helix (wHTH) protein